MGKKSFYKKRLRPFVKSHPVALATIAGAAGAIVVSAIFGTTKARRVIATVESGVKDLTDRTVSRLKKEPAFNQA